MEKIIKVTGKGKLSPRPDTVRLVLTISDTYPEYALALEGSTMATAELKEILEQYGFERRDMKTVCFDVTPKYENVQSRAGTWNRVFRGYEFTHNIKVEFPIDNDRLGRILYALAHSKVGHNFDLMYTVAEPESAKNELLAAAVRDSRAKAETLTAAAGVRLGSIISIDYSRGEINFLMRGMDTDCIASIDDKCAQPKYNIDIEPDDIDVSDNVTVVWSIE